MIRGFVFLLFAATSLSAQISSREPFEAPGFDASAADRGSTLSRLTYDSDGIAVSAYLYEPEVAVKSPLPVVVFNRGSYLRESFPSELLPVMRRFAAGGFIVLAPMLRQSDRSGGRDEVGGADLNDLMQTLHVIKSLKSTDASNIFMYGESRGGMMTYQAVRDGFPLRAAAVFGAFTDLAMYLDEDMGGNGARLANTVWPDFAEKRAAIVHRRSAVAWADKLDVPLLIMHGALDPQVSPLHSLRLAQLLQKAGKRYELVVRAGEKHTLSGWQTERDALAMEWFKRHATSSAATPIAR
jgi:dipeptidyl aminopeptidase/acylaminoacyl peptidase